MYPGPTLDSMTQLVARLPIDLFAIVKSGLFSLLAHERKGSVNVVVMFSSGPLDFFYAPHNQMASVIMNMIFSLTDPCTMCWGWCEKEWWRGAVVRREAVGRSMWRKRKQPA